MKNIDFKSTLLGFFGAVIIGLSINATTVENNTSQYTGGFHVEIGYNDFIVVPGDGLYNIVGSNGYKQ